MSARLLLLDRSVNLIDEGFDAALRIGNLADSSMMASRIGEVRRVVVAAPRYLKQNPRIAEPGDLTKHQIITMAHLPNSWTFPPVAGSSVPRTVQVTPRLVTNSIRGAVASAVGGRGVALFFSYQVAEQVRIGELEVVLAGHEPRGCAAILHGWRRIPAIAGAPRFSSLPTDRLAGRQIMWPLLPKPPASGCPESIRHLRRTF